MNSNGFGDSIANFTKKTGIKTVIDKLSSGLNIPCGCAQRQAWFNNKFPNRNEK